MRTLGTAAVLAALTTLAGCGSATSEDPGTPVADACRSRGAVVAKADLDGGGATSVRLTGPGDGRCADRLVTDGGGWVDVSGLDLVAKGARTVHLKGQDLVLVSSKPHPRGGAQVHLFGAGGPTGLSEITADGQPLVPFVATDGGAAPMTATCTPEGEVAVDTARAHEPPGIVLAWDVTRTTYAIEGGTASKTGSDLVEDAAADPVLRKDRPDLFDGRLFATCS